MKKVHFIMLLLTQIGFAQFGTQQIITSEAIQPRSIQAVDFNGDGFMDVLTASKSDDKIAWYSNTDGQGDFGTQSVIDLVSETIHANVADIDGDGDMDVLAISGPDNLIVWFENLNGEGLFSSRKVISNSVPFAYHVETGDLDGDDDIDVIVSSDTSDTIYWVENIDGEGTFGSLNIIGSSGNNGRYLAIADFDGDNDLDVAASSSGSELLSWFENIDGEGTFGSSITIASGGLAIADIYAADIEGDGDFDIVTSSNGDDEVAWYQNNGFGVFGSKQSISTDVLNARSVFVADLDNDGDNDVLAGGNGIQPIIWLENIDGQGSFSSPQIISTEVEGPSSVYAADVDNDGDMDVFSTTGLDNKVAWYENLTILGVDENGIPHIKIYPNPVYTQLFIKKPQNSKINSVVIFNLLGENILTLDEDVVNIDITGLTSGLYFIHIEDQEGINWMYKFIKK